jgi:hypothetical protein
VQRAVTRLCSALAVAACWFISGTGAAEEPAQDPPPRFAAQPAGPTLAPPELPLTSAATETTYWIVSSRYAAQHPRERSPFGLAYCRRLSDGRVVPVDVASLRAELVPGVPVCVLVHGSFVEWEEHLNESATGYQWIRRAAPGRPLHVVSFTWLSGKPYTGCFAVDIGVRGNRAEFNGFYLAQFLSELPETSPVCVIGHSHGARVALSALHLAGGGIVQDLVFTGNLGQQPLRAVLAAAAVDHHWLNPGERYERALCRGEVINLRNRCDLALKFYPLSRPFSRPALAQTGFTDGDRERLGWLAVRAGEIDVTELIGRNHNWPNYHDASAIAEAIAPFVYFMDRDSAAPAQSSPAAPGQLRLR